MKLALVSLFMLATAAAADTESVGAEVQDALLQDLLEDAADEETSSRRRRRGCCAHRHKPHRHRPHGHRPHGHKPHNHRPHRHHNPGCSADNQIFNCDCQTQTNWFSNVQVFNQCNKGGGNLSGEKQFTWDKNSDTGHVNGKTWGMAVWSEDAAGPDAANVCGKNKWEGWGWQRSQKCKCGCFRSGAIRGKSKKESDMGSGFQGKYLTKCMGVCGVDCDAMGNNGTGQSKRYPALVIHDACQASINNRKSILDVFNGSGGLYNKCADEALHGSTSAAMGPCD